MDREYREIYEEGVQALAAAGIEEAQLDARLLLEHICRTTRQDLLAHGDRKVGEQEQAGYQELIGKRSRHIPLQHLTGVQDFMGLTFRVNENVLIPRQDTEILVEEALRDGCDYVRLLDMCTGSGCILLSLLHYTNNSSGVGIDISEKALQTAKENADWLGVQGAQFRCGNLFAALSEGEKFDVILSNPPYISSGVIAGLMEEVREHEPLQALDGGADGLFFYRRITEEAGHYLNRGGKLYYEIGFDQAQSVTGLLEKHGYKEIRVVKDYAGLDRVVCGTFTG